MKKVTLILAMALVLCLSFGALADTFYSSPSANTPATTTAGITITPYKDRATLASQKKTDLEAAYAAIAGASKVSDLCAAVTESDAVINDLFDVSASAAGTYTVTFTDGQATKGFICLLHYVNGSFERVSGTRNSDGSITFTNDSFSPYALVVSSTSAVKTGDSQPWGYALIAVACAAGAVLLSKKRKAAAQA